MLPLYDVPDQFVHRAGAKVYGMACIADYELYDLNDTLPSFAEVPFKFELEFDRGRRHQWLKQNWTLSFYYSGIYLLLLSGLRQWMRNQPRFELKGLLVLWNGGLALFSIVSSVRMLPEFFRILLDENGCHKYICDGRTLNSPVMLFWTWWFAMSKVWEFGDTIFVILQKCPLTFLHVFHHCTVLIGSWYVGAEVAPVARWFVTMNYFIHAVMYTYFTLEVLRWFHIPRWVSRSITIMQITQMVVGVIVNVYAYEVKRRGGHCDQSDEAIRAAMFLAVAYFALFVGLFFNAYVWKGRGSGKEKIS